MTHYTDNLVYIVYNNTIITGKRQSDYVKLSWSVINTVGTYRIQYIFIIYKHFIIS